MSSAHAAPEMPYFHKFVPSNNQNPGPIAYANHVKQFVSGYLLDLREYGASSHSYIDGCRKECVIDEKTYMLEFEDGYSYIECPGLIKYRERTNPWQGFLLLYDVDSRESFKIIESKLEKLAELIGSKGLPPPDRLPGGDDDSTSCTAVIAAVNQPLYRHTGRVCARGDQNHSCSSKYISSPRQRQQRTDTFTCFPHLPAELKLAILRACVTSSRPIFNRRPANSGINIKVLEVCRFFYEVGTRIFWAENRFESTLPVYLVADSTWPVPGRQRIDATEGRALAERFGCKFFEHSSQSHDQVETLVIAMVRECMERGVDLPTVPSQSVVQGQQRCSIRSLTRSLTQRVSRVFK